MKNITVWLLQNAQHYYLIGMNGQWMSFVQRKWCLLRAIQ
jgi:hypothetical protein